MFHSDTMARVIHADRARDLERAAREHRMLLVEADEPGEPARPTLIQGSPVTPPVSRPARGDSAGFPA